MRDQVIRFTVLMTWILFMETTQCWSQSVHSPINDTLVTFTNRGQKIFGMLHRPVAGTDSLCPGIIMLHGFTGTSVEPHRLFVTTARNLAQKGFYVLRFDFRGSGQSEGDFADMTYRGEVSDALTAISFLGSQPDVDSVRIGVIGLSLGGAVACHVAGAQPNVTSVVLWAPATALNRLAESLARAMLNLSQELTIGFVDWSGNRVGPKFMKQLGNERPLAELLKFDGPVLIIHGDNDKAVPLSDSQTIQRIFNERQKRVELKVIEGADHTFNSVKWENEVIQATVDWFENTLK